MAQDGRWIVVVDDDPGVRDSIAFLLETAGYSVESFSSPAQCLASLQPSMVACLVVDQNMPKMTGLELVTELHSQGVFLPTLLTTGSLSPELLQKATALGVQAIPKPLAEGQLLDFVASL